MPDEVSARPAEPRDGSRPTLVGRAHLLVVLLLQSVMAVELVLLIRSQQWMHVFLVIAVMGAILAPELIRRQTKVEIPSEIQIAAILFVFAALFLGEVRDYYERIWWWDLALHTTAGLLLGIFGFLTVYALNESRNVEVQMRSSFVALFAFLFSIGVGTIWEIFEFGMDQIFGLTMQKPMLDDPSGLTDTMWDLILDTIGAAVVSILGWVYIRKRARRQFIDRGVARMLRRKGSRKVRSQP